MSDRTFRRWARRFEVDGDEGLVDRRSGRAVPRQGDEVARLYRKTRHVTSGSLGGRRST